MTFWVGMAIGFGWAASCFAAWAIGAWNGVHCVRDEIKQADRLEQIEKEMDRYKQSRKGPAEP